MVTSEGTTPSASSTPPLIAVWLSLAVFVIGTTASFVYANTDALEVMAAETDGCPVWCMGQLPFSAAHGFMLAIVTFAVTWFATVVRSRRNGAATTLDR